MKTGASLKNRQGGAVAVMVGISMVVLIGFLAMVIDLGRLYVAKAGLQNAADAAALSGAKELDGTGDGICCGNGTGGSVRSAAYMAINTAGRNTFFGNLGQETVNIGLVNSSNPNIRFSRSQDGAENEGGQWGVSIATAVANPVNKYFIKVDTASGNLTTWFAPIWNIFTTSTYGMAVAGRSKVNITPIAICSIDVRQCPCLKNPDGSDETNCSQGDLQCGYEPGKTYDIAGVNPIGPGTALWLDASATPSNPTCNGSVPDTIPFVCKGEANVSATPGDDVYTNTGLSVPQLAALDSRFGEYVKGVGECDPVTAPPDRNIKEFLLPPASCTPANCSSYTTAPTCNDALGCKWDGSAKNCVPNPPANCSDYVYWMTPAPIAQTSVCTVTGTDQYEANIYNCPWSPNGVYWSAVSGVAASGVPTTNFNYPTSGTPYTQTSGEYFQSGGSGHLDGRRLINLLIVQCKAPGGQCRPARNRIVGQFLLQTRANVSNQVIVEFVRTVSQAEIRAEIRLYR